MSELTLISHPLCPYVQRAAIALDEKEVPFARVWIDLADKPDWFHAVSPLGKVPVLRVGEQALFESAVIVEYLEETVGRPLHPADPLDRARHRAWMVYGSAILDRIARFYNAPGETDLWREAQTLSDMFDRLEAELGAGPWFADTGFSLVDAVFAPIFRYFDVFDRIADFGILAGKPKLAAWRGALSARPSVMGAVAPDYPDRLLAFLSDRKGAMGRYADAA